MNRVTVIILIALIVIIFVAGLLFGENLFTTAGQNNRFIVQGKSLQKDIIVKKPVNQMPSLTPNPNIDYKIQRMVVDKSIDYKILDASPRVPVPDDLKPYRKRLGLRFFILNYKQESMQKTRR